MLSNQERRRAALEWWRKLTPQKQKDFAHKTFPDKPFIMVSTSSNFIEQVWEQSHV